MARLNWIEVRGFRAFGPGPQRVCLTGPMALVWGPNSQGKTSFAEAIEFLLTGKTVRREFLSSATREFADSLRNAHLPDSDRRVEVSAEIVDAAGVAHAVRRVLDADYSPSSACSSTLRIDGAVASDLSSLGVRLSLPPLEAPVLMQHTMRYVLSAKPQDRTDYFKALLELADLEAVRGAIDRARSSLRAPTSPALEALARCQGQAVLTSAFQPLGAGAPTQRRVLDSISDGLERLLSAGPDPVPSSHEDRVAVARRLIEERERGAFPVDALRAGTLVAATGIDAAIWQALDHFATLVAGVDQEASRLAELFTAVLRIPTVGAASGPVDCPVCQTPNALHPARIAELRQHLEESAAFRTARAEALPALRRVTEFADDAQRNVFGSCPAFLGWDDPERARRGFSEEAVIEMLGSASAFARPWSERIAPLRDSLAGVAASAAGLRQITGGINVDALRAEQVGAARVAAAALVGALSAFASTLTAYRGAQGPVVATLEAEVARRSQTTALRDVVLLADQVAPLLESLVLARAHDQVASKLDRAVREIDAATGRVLDAKFDALGDEVGRWWSLLRPEEPTSFAGIQRAGTGRRYIDLKAKLSPEADGSGAHALRDVVAVFSDSQLNCLGLAAFLARTVRAGAGFVVLDDPVPASDDEHRAFFLERVLGELLASSCQVILLTHEQRTWKDAQLRYQHLPLNVFQIALDDPRLGPIIEETADTLDAALNRARPYIGRNHPDVRKTAAERRRDATERLCKLLILQDLHASGNRSANLSDYDGKNLGQLFPLVEPLLTRDPSDSGKLRVIAAQLNPGNHDDTTPSAADLKVSYGNLKAFRRDYLGAATAAPASA